MTDHRGNHVEESTVSVSPCSGAYPKLAPSKILSQRVTSRIPTRSFVSHGDNCVFSYTASSGRQPDSCSAEAQHQLPVVQASNHKWLRVKRTKEPRRASGVTHGQRQGGPPPRITSHLPRPCQPDGPIERGYPQGMPAVLAQNGRGYRPTPSRKAPP